jgi:hypothetical protein
MGTKAASGFGAEGGPQEAGRERPDPLTAAQRRYLERGLKEPGGKLPLFDQDGREIPRRTIEACMAHGWAEPWTPNPVRPGWLVCRLTEAGYRVLGQEPPGKGSGQGN